VDLHREKPVGRAGQKIKKIQIFDGGGFHLSDPQKETVRAAGSVSIVITHPRVELSLASIEKGGSEG